MKFAPGECRPGDMIRVRLGSVYHYGVFVSEEEVIAFGLPPVPEYREDPLRETVCATDIDAFSCGQIVEIGLPDRRERKKRRAPEQTVAAARARLGETGYDLIRNNCEHFAYACVFGEKRSLQQEQTLRRWTDRPVCSLYLAPIDRAPVWEELYPPERAAEIAACGSPEVRAAKRADWSLLRLAARHCFGLELTDLQFEKTRHGQWRCDGFSFSLCHTEELAAVAVSNGPVGVDMESVSAFRARRSPDRLRALHDRWLTRAEQAAWPPEPEAFLCCWTRKEAAFKRSGHGSFKPKSTDSLDFEGFTCRIPALPELILSLCGPHAGQAQIFLVSGNRADPIDYQPIAGR